jgi:hypothetical protein
MKQWKQKLFQLYVVGVRYQNISDSTVSTQPVFLIVHGVVANMKSSQCFHQIFFNTAGCCNDTVDHFVLSEVSDDVSHATGAHVGSVAEENSASNFFSVFWVGCLFVIVGVEWFVRKPPANHVIDDFDGFGEIGGLKTGGGIRLEDLFVVDALIEIVASNNVGFEFFVHEEHFSMDFLLEIFVLSVCFFRLSRH